MKLKQHWENLKLNFIDKSVREKVFVFISTIIFGFVSSACVVINFLTKEYVIGWASVASLVLLSTLAVIEIVFYSKKIKINSLIFSIPMAAVIASLAFLYLFFAPADCLYFYWICIIPIVLCISFGFRDGVIAGILMLLIIILIFYVPCLYQLTKTENIEQHWFMKAVFIIQFIVSFIIGMLLAFVNRTIIKKLEVLKDLYYDEANTDSLTGLKNQAYYLSYVNGLTETVKEGDTIGLMFIDIDDFKLYNDKYGHTVGNDVLIGVAKKLNEVPHALLVRWGGDEFAIVERNITREEFIAKANYLLKSVEGLPQGVTISIGLAYYTVDDNFNFQKIFNEADMQAIRAKGKGKNCIVIKEKK